MASVLPYEQLPLWAVAALLLGLQAVFYWIGHAIGRLRQKRGEKPTEGIGILSGAILALCAFVFALTLQLATGRMHERRVEGWTEATAIQDAWEQAQAVGGPEARSIQAALREYLDLRRQSLRLSYSDPQIPDLAARTDALLTQIGGHRDKITASRTDPVAAGLVEAIGKVSSATLVQTLAIDNQMPKAINRLMLILISAGMLVVGFQVGFTGKHHIALTVILIGIWTYVIMLILYFGDARTGPFRISTEAYDMVLERISPGP